MRLVEPGEKYLWALKEFLAGVEWDEDKDVWLIATSCAGQYLRDHDDPELLEGLVQIVESRPEFPEDESAAVEALARGLGDEYRTFPDLGGTVLKDEWRRDVMTRAKARLERQRRF